MVRLSRAIFLGVAALQGLHGVALRVPGVRQIEGVVLDTLLGPAEDFDYVSVTAPSVTPPTAS